MKDWAEAVWLWSPVAGAAISAVALVMTVVNVRILRRPGAAPLGCASAPGASAAVASGAERTTVTVCIPARNEEANLAAAAHCALASSGVDLRVLVYDDESTDRTQAVLRALVAEDARVRGVLTRPLPTGWNGKQWACQRMGEAADSEWLFFTDADVRLEPACLAAAVAEARALNAALLSTVPRQETGTLAERLVVPLIHWMLLSWLPMPRMRCTNDPATSAGCGQFLLVQREAWHRAGGHAAFRGSMHDGIKLPRAVRRVGLHTDLFDGTALVSCRMYRGAAEVWRGFTKNAYEGLGSPVVLAVFTLLEGLCLLPWIWLAWAVARAALGVPLPDAAPSGGVDGVLGASDGAASTTWTLPQATPVALAAVVMQLVQRALLAARFRQSWVGAFLHPAGLVALLSIQWWSAWLHGSGARAWRGRGYGRGVPPGAAATGS